MGDAHPLGIATSRASTASLANASRQDHERETKGRHGEPCRGPVRHAEAEVATMVPISTGPMTPARFMELELKASIVPRSRSE